MTTIFSACRLFLSNLQVHRKVFLQKKDLESNFVDEKNKSLIFLLLGIHYKPLVRTTRSNLHENPIMFHRHLFIPVEIL